MAGFSALENDFMRKRCRGRVRTRGKVVLNAYNRMVAYFAYAQLSNKWREWTFRTISQRQAETLVAAGEAMAITRMEDGVVRVVGYRALQPTTWERPSPTTLTFGTMCAVGNQDAEQVADPRYRLTRRERMEIVKFKVWPLIGDTKAVAVRPRISEADRREAEKLLGRERREPRIYQTLSGRTVMIDSGMLGAA
jgi:hypothetical protein